MEITDYYGRGVDLRISVKEVRADDNDPDDQPVIYISSSPNEIELTLTAAEGLELARLIANCASGILKPKAEHATSP